ncbi:hypothetical protein Tco_0004078 [Tanacetum coccineum]
MVLFSGIDESKKKMRITFNGTLTGVSTEDANQKFLRLTGYLRVHKMSPVVSSESTWSTYVVSYGYGIATPSGYQLTKGNISSSLH